MGTADRTYRREGRGARWTALVGAACAFTLAVLVGVYSPGARIIEHADARWTPLAQGPQRKDAVSAADPGRQERWIGVHDPSTQGQLERPHLTSKPPSHHNRFTPRHGLAPGPEVQVATRTRMLLSCVLPARHGRRADRPVLANCPAQGPPRAA